MVSLNRTVLIGRLTRDPEVRCTKEETPVANFSLAIERGFKNPKNGNVDFIDCVAWRGLAKICGQYLKKGRLVAIEGKLRLRKFETKDGKKRNKIEVYADNMQMLDNKFYTAALKEKETEPEIEIIST